MLDIIIALIAAIIALAFICFCIWLPRFLLHKQAIDPAKAVELEDSYRKTVAQIIGGAALVFTFSWTFIKDSDSISETRRENSYGQYIEAIKLLGDSNQTARVAASYAIAKITEDYPAYIPVAKAIVMSLITSTPGSADPSVSFHRDRVIGSDVQTAINILNSEPGWVNHSGSQLNFEGSYLVGAKFSGTTGFVGARFYSAVLFGADFSGADLTGAKFDGAQLSDWEAYGGAGSNSPGAWTQGTPSQWKPREHYRYVGDFQGATLKYATFTGAGLTGALFANADIDGADFSRANISRANFKGAKNVTKAKFFETYYNGDRPVFDSGIAVVFDNEASDANHEIHIGSC